MDADRFDAWTLALTAAHSRRALVRALVGGALAAGLGLAGGREAGAAPLRAAHKPCSQDGQCNGGLCYRRGRCSKGGKLTGLCRCGCTGVNPCPGDLFCCGQGDKIPVCAVLDGGACANDTDCCNGLCRGGICCRAIGAACGPGKVCCTIDGRDFTCLPGSNVCGA